MSPEQWVSFDMAPDGKRFLVIIPELVGHDQPLTVFLNMIRKGPTF
jgi:hypothetical protein